MVWMMVLQKPRTMPDWSGTDSAAEQQSVVTEEMNANISRISDMSTNVSASITQVADASSEMSAMSHKLQSAVDNFNSE